MLPLSPTALGWRRRSAQLLVYLLLASGAGMAHANNEETPEPPTATTATTATTADSVAPTAPALEESTSIQAPALGLKVPETGGLTVPVQTHLLSTPNRPKDNNNNNNNNDDDDDDGDGHTDGGKLPKVDLQFPQEYGLASWYGIKHHQKRTASGERFDMHGFTAAHPTLPFGSRVCVRSALTGREVIVRVNDRGPHGGKRMIDLSRAAADALGITQIGTKPVTIQALPDEDSSCPTPTPTLRKGKIRPSKTKWGHQRG